MCVCLPACVAGRRGLPSGGGNADAFELARGNAFLPFGRAGDVGTGAASVHGHGDGHVHHIKALVVACNTATAAAIHEARARHPTLPVVGVEPALKPAVAASKTKRIGVIGTRGTLTSVKFAKLLASLHGQAEFIVQPCDGLAHAIERSTVLAIPKAPAATETLALCARYTGTMGGFGSQPGEIDTLVLGCTHYVFIQDELRRLLGPAVQLIATGQPVARHTRRLLQAADMLALDSDTPDPACAITLLTTGMLAPLQNAARRWLQLPAQCCASMDLPTQGINPVE